MQKLNNFIYMIASAIVANMAYVMGGVQNVAHAAKTCSYAYKYTDSAERGHVANYIACTSACNAYVGSKNMMSYSYNNSNSSCGCIYTYQSTAYGTLSDGSSERCGRNVYCVAVYRPAYNNSIQTRSSYVGTRCYSDTGNAGYMMVSRDYYSGKYTYYTSCLCCPCIGNGPMGESCLGSQNSAPSSYMMRVLSRPGASLISDCYVVGAAYDPTGLYEYTDTDKCYFTEY